MESPFVRSHLCVDSGAFALKTLQVHDVVPASHDLSWARMLIHDFAIKTDRLAQLMGADVTTVRKEFKAWVGTQTFSWQQGLDTCLFLARMGSPLPWGTNPDD